MRAGEEVLTGSIAPGEFVEEHSWEIGPGKMLVTRTKLVNSFHEELLLWKGRVSALWSVVGHLCIPHLAVSQMEEESSRAWL
jgi:hypothetical protein